MRNRHHVYDVEVIIAPLDTTIRAALRARLGNDRASREAGAALGGVLDGALEVAEAPLGADAPTQLTEVLRRRLAARPGPHDDLLIASEAGLSEAAEVVRFGLEQGVPVLIWPNGASAQSPGASRAHPRLTAREREILTLVAGGVSNKGIARALQVSPNTVKFHLATLFHKLAVTTRAEAIAAAARSGELSL